MQQAISEALPRTSASARKSTTLYVWRAGLLVDVEVPAEIGLDGFVQDVHHIGAAHGHMMHGNRSWRRRLRPYHTDPLVR
ncbi:MAG: hypothetical protein J5913_01285 [Prevotella sp.]|nr:hypothetical protein [Prevotella sp.]